MYIGMKRKNRLLLNNFFFQLVNWCFEPSQPQRTASRLNTNFNLSPSHSFQKSSYHKSRFWAYLYSAGIQHGNLPPAG